MGNKFMKFVCLILGHSKICSLFWGYRSCGRCGETLGDNVASMDFGAEDAVIIGHNCKVCRKNYKSCSWKDKLFVKNPFKKEEVIKGVKDNGN